VDRKRYIQVAREESLKLVEQRGDVVAVFICGSVAHGDPEEYSDVDLRVVIDTEFDLPVPSFVRRYGVPLEWTYCAKRQYEDMIQVLNDPFISLETVGSTILYDPTNFIRDLIRDIKPVYKEHRYVKARAQNLLEQPKQWLSSLRDMGEELSKLPEYVYAWHLRCIITILAKVVLVLTSIPPGGMKLFVSLRVSAERLQHEELFSLGLDAMGAQDITKEEVEEFADGIFKVFEYVNSMVDPCKLHHWTLLPDKREYYQLGTQWLVSRGFHREAIWPLLTVAPLCAMEIHEAKLDSRMLEKCVSFLYRLGFQPFGDTNKKLDLLQRWIQQIQQIIEQTVS